MCATRSTVIAADVAAEALAREPGVLAVVTPLTGEMLRSQEEVRLVGSEEPNPGLKCGRDIDPRDD